MNQGQVYLDSTPSGTPKHACQSSPRAHREHKNAPNVIRGVYGVNITFERRFAFLRFYA